MISIRLEKFLVEQGSGREPYSWPMLKRIALLLGTTGNSEGKDFVYNKEMKIGVLRGGPSSSYDTSLTSGEFVLKLLREEPEKYQPVDIFISKEGDWHVAGRRYEPHLALKNIDIAWNALHGEYGEDGQASQLLSNLHVPHTGSTTLGLSIAINKDLAKEAYLKAKLNTPKHLVLTGDVSQGDILTVFHTFALPVVVKPVRGRASLGVKVAKSFNELKEYVAEAFKHAERVLVEEYIKGKEVSCSILSNFRNEELYAPVPTSSDLKLDMHKKLEKMAKQAHEALGLRHYSTSDFIITPKQKIYIIETNALPDLHGEARLIKSLGSVGVTPKEFVRHIISLTV